MKASLKHVVANERGRGLTQLGDRKVQKPACLKMERKKRKTTCIRFVLWDKVGDADAGRHGV